MIYNNIEEFISLKPAYYRFLKSISLSRAVGPGGCGRFDVVITLSKVSGEAIEDLRLRCTGAFDISVKDIESMSGLQVDIETVKDRQIEGASYRVIEQEENAFSFFCDEFFVELIK